MSTCLESLNDVVTDSPLNAHDVVARQVDRIGTGGAHPAWRLDRFLLVQAVVDEVGDHLHVPLGLSVATRRAAYPADLPFVRDQVAVECVHGALATLDHIGMALFEGEATSGTIVEHDSGLTGNHLATEPG